MCGILSVGLGLGVLALAVAAGIMVTLGLVLWVIFRDDDNG